LHTLERLVSTSNQDYSPSADSPTPLAFVTEVAMKIE